MKSNAPFNLIRIIIVLVLMFSFGCGGGSDSEDDNGNTTSTYYRDSDNDGFGDPNVTTNATSMPNGYTTDNTDCNDSNDTIYPGAIENCNDGVDNDCDGDTDGNDTECFIPPTPDLKWGEGNWGERNWQ